MTDDDFGRKIIEQGWLQGSIVRAQDVPVLSDTAPRDRRGVMLTHPCDLRNRSLEREPYAHLLPASEVKKVDNNLTFAKNPRRLHVPAQHSARGAGDELILDLCFHDMLVIERDRLVRVQPDPECQLDGDSVAILRRWLANRFERDALPDSFNAILDSDKERFQRAIRALNPYVASLYISLFPDRDIEDGEKYSVDMVAIYVEPSDVPTEAEEAARELRSCLESCGIEVTSFYIRRPDHVSLHTVWRMNRLSFDYLSLRDEATIAPSRL